ncbi:hypothetical protein CYMTET_53298 [Cymbomonas tetramitiformis]|uniref:Uncharacterized protein n=1 Tax=Cymbomonas tetramitiformis TaxID=36881 RepID=A0AAE0EQ69_9CHLO|nr:hypothetical protein CYMTET_53298 [Cymbomonas tetramitiformis]
MPRSYPATIQIVALAKKTAKKKGGSAPAKKSGFGGFKASKAEEKGSEPEELDLSKVKTRDQFEVLVRTGPEASWWPVAEVVVEGGADIEAALKERRGALREGAKKVPAVVLKTKGNVAELNKLEYSIRTLSSVADEEEGQAEGDAEGDAEEQAEGDVQEAESGGEKETEADSEEIKTVSLAGAVQTKVPALIFITANEDKPPPGSLWARNKASAGRPVTSQKSN